MKNFKRIFLTLVFLVALSIVNNAFAAGPPGPPGGGGGGPPCWPPPCVPIDGGIGYLIAAGALLGIKKTNDLYQNRKKG
ncbi:MAG: hypothetical protein Kow0079_01900 [Vicingaceae bacterium]